MTMLVRTSQGGWAMMSDQIEEIALEFRKGILNGRTSTAMCYMVSWALAGYLQFCGEQCELTKGEVTQGEDIWEHYWITFPNKIILDATADQFSELDGGKRPKVYIGIKPDWYVEVK